MPTFQTRRGPIKVSFLEIIAGPPSLRTKAQRVVSAPAATPAAPTTPAPAAEPAKTEEAKPAAEATKPAEDAAKPAEETPKPAEAAPKPEDPAAAKAKEVTFTAEEDATLLKLKDEKKSWKEMSTLMEGKAVYQLKNRYKELMIAQSAAKKEAEKKATEKTEESKEKPADETQGKEKKDKKGKKEKHKHEAVEKVNEKIVEKVVYVHATDKFTKDELIFMNDIAQKCDQRKWIYAASRLFDKTGRRVEPSEVKEGVEQLPK